MCVCLSVCVCVCVCACRVHCACHEVHFHCSVLTSNTYVKTKIILIDKCTSQPIFTLFWHIYRVSELCSLPLPNDKVWTRSAHSLVMSIFTHPAVCMKHSVRNILVRAHHFCMRLLVLLFFVFFPPLCSVAILLRCQSVDNKRVKITFSPLSPSADASFSLSLSTYGQNL